MATDVIMVTQQNSKISSPSQSGIDTTGRIHPMKAKGHLVEEKFYQKPVGWLYKQGSNIKGGVDCFIGNGNDYKLGNLNDIALAGCSLGLATALMLQKASLSQKMMEFVGAGTFLLGMSLFPKMFINAPILLHYGIDVDQEFVDSEGRRKKFYQDPQYTPWDLMTKEQFETMGLKMGIDYDDPYKFDKIKDKANQITTQANTLWMITAGMGSVLLGALTANMLEPYIKDMATDINIEGCKAKLKSVNMDKIITDAGSKKASRRIEGFFENNYKGKILTDDILLQSINIMTKREGEGLEKLKEAIDKDLSILAENNKDSTKELSYQTDDLLENLWNSEVCLENEQKKKFSDVIKDVDNVQQLKEKLNLTDMETVSISQIKTQVSDKNFKNYVDKYYSDVLSKKNVVDNYLISNFKDINKLIQSYDKLSNPLMMFIDSKVEGEDSLISKLNTNLTETILGSKVLNLNLKELKEVSKDSTDGKKVIKSALHKVVQSDKKYNKAMNAILESYKKLVFNTFEDEKLILKYSTDVKNKMYVLRTSCKPDYKNLEDTLFGVGTNPEIFQAERKYLDGIFKTNNRIHRQILALDYVYRSKDDDKFKEIFNGIKECLSKKSENESLAFDSVEYNDFKNLCEKFALEYDSNIFTNKLCLEDKDAALYKMVYEAFTYEHLDNKTKELIAKVEKEVNLNENILELTKNHFDENNQKEWTRCYNNLSLSSYTNDLIYSAVGGSYDHNRPSLQTNSYGGSSFNTQVSIMEDSFCDLVRKGSESKYNTKLWKVVFGVSFAVLAVATVAATFGFGKEKQSQQGVV